MKKSKDIQDFMRLQRYLKSYVVQYLFFILIAGGSQFLTFLFVGNLLKKIVECVQYANNTFQLVHSIEYLLAIFLFTCLMAFGVYKIKKIEEKIRLNLRKQMIQKYISADELQVEKITNDDMMNRLSIDLTKSVELVGWIIVGTIYMPFISGIFSLVYVCKMNYLVAVISIGIVAVEFFLLKLFSKKRKTLHEHLVLLQKEINNTFFEEKNGIIDVKTFCLKSHFYEKILHLVKNLNQNNKTYTRLNGIRITVSQFYMECFSNLVLLVLGAILASSHVIEFADIMVAIALLDQITQMIFAVGNIKIMINEYAIHERRIFEVLDLPEQKSYQKQMNIKTYALQMNHVSFAYDTSMVLSDVSLEIFTGEKIAIVGGSGSGKSTMLKLLLGLYKPNEGEILEKPNLKRAYVPQDVSLLEKSVLENITLSTRQSIREVQKSASMVKANEFIVKKPDGYFYVIGEDGAGFSGGQKTRIILTRALVQKADVIFLDEVTSALDTKTAKEIIETLLTLPTTVVMVTHRLVDMDNFDKIVVLENGKISGVGKHSDLLEENFCYAQMYKKAMRTSDTIPLK